MGWSTMPVATTQHSGAAFRAAEAFAEAIHSTPEWEEWESARSEVRTDIGFQALAAKHRALAENVRRATGAGHGVTGVSAELDALRAQLQQHPAALRQQAALLALIGLLRTLNSALSHTLGIDFVQLASPPRGGGCCG